MELMFPTLFEAWYAFEYANRNLLAVENWIVASFLPGSSDLLSIHAATDISNESSNGNGPITGVTEGIRNSFQPKISSFFT